MANGPTHYEIKPKTVFFAADVMFRPDRTYLVKRDVYEGLSPDGKPFKDKCENAKAVTKHKVRQ